MKKLSLMALISATMLMAGGDIAPVPEDAKVAPICDTAEKVFVQEDGKLMWQDEKYTDADARAFQRNRSTGKAGSASYAKNYCRTLNYAGYSDWRLPTSEELMSVYDFADRNFENWISENYWSSTPSDAGKSYVVYAADGHRYRKNTKVSAYIRCVRCIAE